MVPPLFGHAPVSVEMLPPVSVVEIGVSDGVSAVDHFVVAHVHAHMGNAVVAVHAFPQGALEEDQVPRPGFRRGDLAA